MATKTRKTPPKTQPKNPQFELLHPRDHRGRFTKSSTRRMNAADIDRTRAAIRGLKPRDMPDANRAAGYLSGLRQADRTPGVNRYLGDGWRAVNDALRRGDSHADVAELDAAMRPLPDDLVVTRQIPASVFAGDDIDLSHLEGLKIRDAAPAAASLGGDAQPAAGMVTMRIAVPAGTRALVDPAGRGVILDRDVDLAITKAKRNAAGGWDVSAVAIGDRGDVSDQRPQSLPDDLSTWDDDQLMDAVGWLGAQGRDSDLIRVADELDRREAQAPHYTIMQDPETMTDDELDGAFADASTAGDELAIEALYEEYGRREQAAADAAAKASQPPAQPAMVGDSYRGWMNLAGSPFLDGYGDSTPETRDRAQRAMRRAYGLPEDASQEEFAAALKTDDRPHEERTGWYLAWYRKLAAADGISPDDTARYGPPDDDAGATLYYDRQLAKASAKASAIARAKAADDREAKIAAGPSGPALVVNPIGEVGSLAFGGSDTRSRLDEARRRMLGLDRAADDKAVKAAEKADGRAPHERAAHLLGWYRLIAEADGVKPGSWEWGPADAPGAEVRPTVVPSSLPKPEQLEQAIKQVAIDDRNAGNEATAQRYLIAWRRVMGLPDDAEDGEYRAALRHDDRTSKQRAAAFLANFRQVGEEHDVDRTDPFRYGPLEKAPKRKAHWQETTPEQDRRLDELLGRGWDYADAYAEVHNLDPADVKAARARGAVDRHAGETTDKAVRRQYDEHVSLQYLVAERATRGHMLSKAGRAAGIDPKELFSGPVARFRKYASEDLQRHLQDVGGRRTFAQFKSQVLGRRRDIVAAEKTRLAGNGKDFG